MKARIALVLGVTLLLAAACTSGDDTSTSDTSTTGGPATTVAPTGPSPGVTASTIKIGVTYVDTEALKSVGLDYNLGDHKAVYNALVKDINDHGGINGRKLQLVISPVDATKTASQDAACLKLTEDDKVFLITGFFLNDAVLCPLETHNTAVVGSAMTPEWLDRAKAPWITWQADTDLPVTVARTFAKAGDLDGKVAVYGATRDAEMINKQVVPALKDEGITPVAVGLNDAPADDAAAGKAKTKVIAQSFKSAGADTVLLVGASSEGWPDAMSDDTSYRPKLRFTSTVSVAAFSTNKANPDTSILDGALAGGGYGPDQARFEEPEMQKCIAVLKKAGIDTPAPKDVGTEPSNQPYQAAFQACPDMALTRAVLEQAGKTLNYGTLRNAFDGLKITIPGDPGERTYGPRPDLDGDPQAYVFAWDESKKSLVRQNS
jgi:hypothetical protein